MDEATLYSLHSGRGTDAKDRDRLDRLEVAFARYLRSEGKHLREIAALLGIKMADVKRLLG